MLDCISTPREREIPDSPPLRGHVSVPSALVLSRRGWSSGSSTTLEEPEGRHRTGGVGSRKRRRRLPTRVSPCLYGWGGGTPVVPTVTRQHAHSEPLPSYANGRVLPKRVTPTRHGVQEEGSKSEKGHRPRPVPPEPRGSDIEKRYRTSPGPRATTE